MSIVAVLLLWAVLMLAGRGLLRCFPQREDGLSRVGLWTLGGLFALHFFLTILGAVGWRWSLGTLVFFVVGVLALGLRGSPSEQRQQRLLGSRWSWGLILAFGGAVALGYAAVSLWTTNPDFIFHWGVKGHRFFLSGGVDEAYLLKPWNRLSHPDYPFLQPQLFAVTALFRGFYDESAMLLQNSLWCFLTALFARQAMMTAGASKFAAESAAAVVGLTLAMFSVAHLLSGGPDVIIAWVLVACAGPLFSAGARGESRLEISSWDVQIAFAAAVGAAAKTEGIPLAASALAVYGLRQGFQLRPWPWKRLAMLSLPVLMATVPWWIQIRRLGVVGRLNAGPFEVGHWDAIAPELLRSLLHSHWHGIPVLLAAALPFVFVSRRTRPLAIVATAQILLYIYVYFTALTVPEMHVRTSFTRVLCHVVPALWVATFLITDRWMARRRLQKAPTSARPQTLP